MKELKSAAASGAAIAIGATAYVSCSNPLLGAFLFSVALFVICVFGLNLYTGKVGYFFVLKKKGILAITWFGNLLGAMAASLLLRLAKPSLAASAEALMLQKYSQSPVQTAILAMFCGMMMFMAVQNYQKSQGEVHRLFGIVLCIMAFIVCGFEHSIADICYFSFTVHSVESLIHAVWYVLLATLCNGIGAVLFWWLSGQKTEE